MQDKKTIAFVEKAKIVHADKYDYTETKYNGYHSNITYLCQKHGLVIQKAGDHLRSKFGCPKCGKELKQSNKLFQKEFIQKAIEIHGDKYDYSNINFTSTKKKINIFCKTHKKIFSQYAGSHLQGYGCPKCGIEKMKKSKSAKPSKVKKYFRKHSTNKKDNNIVVEQFKQVHGDKYDYSSVVYKGDRIKVEIYCDKCKESFIQKPSSHLQGAGCPWCSGRIKDTKHWIEKAIKVHGDKYDYSETQYINIKTKVKILCKEHGIFEILPQKHLLRKQGCSVCGENKLRNTFSYSKDDFIKKAKEIHKNKYNYSRVIYKNGKEKVEIICSKHGSFWQSPQKHVNRGDGCPECMYENRKMTIKDFVKRAKEIHINKYDYSNIKLEFNNKAMYALNIICLTHGIFSQRVDGHLKGVGCPRCNSSKGEEKIREFFKKNNIPYDTEMAVKKLFPNSLMTLGYEKKRYDFVLKDKKIIIEFDGEQHFKAVDFQSKMTEEEKYTKFLKDAKTDKIKDELAITHGYKILRIPFWEIDNIDEILEKLLINKDDTIFEKYNLQQNKLQYEMVYKLSIKTKEDYKQFLCEMENAEYL